MSQVVLSLIASYSAMYGVDPNLAAAVIALESKFNTEAVGALGEVGLMQLRPEYFSASCRTSTLQKMLPSEVVCGFELFDAETNIRIGIRHLAELQRTCKHKDDATYVVCHNVGVTGGNRIQKPKQFIYYKKVMSEYERIQLLGLFDDDALDSIASTDSILTVAGEL